jgi:hypothetical protein
VNKRILLIISISTASIGLILIAVLVYNLQVREIAENSAAIPIQTTPVSPLSSTSSIKGLNLENVIPVYESNDFICQDKSELYRANYFRISCEQKTADFDMTIHVFTSDQKNVNLIETRINQLSKPSDDQALNFLGFITQLPIEGLDADSLKQWIKITLPTLDKYPGMVADKTFDGLELRLYGSPEGRSLEITAIK